MKKAIIFTIVGAFLLSFAQSSIKIKKDDPKLNNRAYVVPQENTTRLSNPDTGIAKSFNSRDALGTLLDSSSNGYGLVVSTTRPIDEADDKFIVVYRQYAGEMTTHGQLGSSEAELDDFLDDEDWTKHTNINANGNPEWGGGGVCEDGTCAQGRYPSAAASEDYPYAIWNEYTGLNSTYGGKAYYTYDEFGWDGDSYAYPYPIDLQWWDEPKDQWVSSAAYSFNDDDGMGVMNTIFNDWTRTTTCFFHSEVIEDGLIVFGTEQTSVLDIPAHFGDSGYITSPSISMNDNGDGVVGVLGIFAGFDAASGDCSEDAHSCNHIPIFKLTDDHGYSWYGDAASDGYYFIPDNVFEDIWANNVLPNTEDRDGDGVGDGFDYDYCHDYDTDGNCGDADDDGECDNVEVGAYELVDWWSWYDWDLRVDTDGNVHAIMSFVPQSAEYIHFIDGATGFYHLTIDKDHIDNPGAVNTPEGWNWSFLLDGGDTWMWDIDGDGYSELFTTHVNLSFAADDPDVVWAVLNMAEAGGFVDAETEQGWNDCAQWDTYIPSAGDLETWSLDLWVSKSTDGGITWNETVNITNSEGTLTDGRYNGPEEMYPHTTALSSSDEVYFMYQMPNWDWNEIGDPTGPDHMNYVYAAHASYPEGDLSSEDNINEDSMVPGTFALNQNYPNPFNPSTTINFSIPFSSHVDINIYDLNGKLINTLVNDNLVSGNHSIVWNGDNMIGNDVAGGIYIYTLKSDDVSISQKMILVK